MTNEVRIEISTICNYKCEFCPHSTDFNRSKTTMSFEFFKEILDKVYIQAPHINFCTLSGMGETFLDHTIFKKIEYAQSLGYSMNILSNGSTLNDEKIKKLIDLSIFSLHISFHSANKLYYNSLTKSDNFDLVVENINKLSDQRKNMRLIITAVVPEYNEEEIISIRELIENKVDLLEIWKPHNWTSWGLYREGNVNKSTCGRPENGPLQIQIDGTINMCCFDYNGKLLLGDIKNQSIEEIFNGSEYIKLYNTHKEAKILDSDYICRNCDQIRDVGKIVYYNNKFSEEDRINRTSSMFAKMHN